MNIFLSGGCKNGKSHLAQRLAKQLAAGGPLWYIATMIPHDDEDNDRIRRHIEDRAGWGFETIEIGKNIENCLAKTECKGSCLLDSVTALLANEMFAPDGAIDEGAADRVANGLLAVADGMEHAVFVSDWIYDDACQYDAQTEGYRKGLAKLDRLLAARCDAVAEISGGLPFWHKGGAPL